MDDSLHFSPNMPVATIHWRNNRGLYLEIPLYSNALGTIPIAEALINKGVGIGTALAFMMATTAYLYRK